MPELQSTWMVDKRMISRVNSKCKASNDGVHDYERDIFYWLINTKDYRKFKRRIEDELSKLKINCWTYIRLDIPTRLSVRDCLGSVTKQHLELYEIEGFYDSDLIMQHLQESMYPIFKSDVDDYVQNSPLMTASLKRYRELSEMNNRFGWKDSYSIPLVSENGNGRAAFAVNSSEVDSATFRKYVLANSDKLVALGRAINDAGVMNFPDFFTDGKRVFEKLVNSQPFNLLLTMVKYDLTLSQAAQHLGISINTAQKHVLNIRRALGAKTNYGAYEAAMQQGLIVAS